MRIANKIKRIVLSLTLGASVTFSSVSCTNEEVAASVALAYLFAVGVSHSANGQYYYRVDSCTRRSYWHRGNRLWPRDCRYYDQWGETYIVLDQRYDRIYVWED